jgi:hypothetical protein
MGIVDSAPSRGGTEAELRRNTAKDTLRQHDSLGLDEKRKLPH